MPWARFDDRYPWNRKVRGLSDLAFRVDVTAICWSTEQLTDGWLPPGTMSALGLHRNCTRVARMLLRAGRWHEPGHECTSEYCYPIESGYLIHDWQEYNRPREQVRRERKARQERQERWRRKHRNDASQNASPNASRNASKDGDPPRPAPKEAGARRPRAADAAADPSGAAAQPIKNGRLDGLALLQEIDRQQAEQDRASRQRLHDNLPDIFPSPE